MMGTFATLIRAPKKAPKGAKNKHKFYEKYKKYTQLEFVAL